MKSASLVLPGLLIALMAAPALADGDGIPAADAVGTVQLAQVTTEEWIEALKTPVEADALESRDRRTRGLRVTPNAPPPATGVQFKVQFSFGSAELTDEARTVLSELGTALVSDQLAPFRFRITGHTDAIGEDAFNLDLSEMRANAVRNYLSANFEIDQARLQSVGLGESMLLVPGNPAADANRRVEIMNVGVDG